MTNHSEVQELMNHNLSYLSPFASTSQLLWSRFPYQRWNLGPGQWNCGVLTTGLQGNFSCLSIHRFWGIFHPVFTGSHETTSGINHNSCSLTHPLLILFLFLSHSLRRPPEITSPQNKPFAPILEYQSLKWSCFWNNQVEVSEGTWICRLETQVETLGWKIFNI